MSEGVTVIVRTEGYADLLDRLAAVFAAEAHTDMEPPMHDDSRLLDMGASKLALEAMVYGKVKRRSHRKPKSRTARRAMQKASRRRNR